jgi:hypothetical protein
MTEGAHPDRAEEAAYADAPKRKLPRWSYHQKAYFSLLVFVAAAGLPLIGVPSLRARLRSRVHTLRAAALAEPVAPSPVAAKTGENQEPFPKEYAHTAAHPSYLPKIDVPTRAPYRIVLGESNPESPPVAAAPASASVKPKTPVADKAAPAAEDAAASGAASGTESQYRKGKEEQEAYDLLLNANQILAEMVKGSEPTLKFQDWGATLKDQGSYYVMVSFLHAADNTVRKYIWNVRLAAKEVVALSSYAREISK